MKEDLLKESTHKLLKMANKLIKDMERSGSGIGKDREKLKIAVLGSYSIQHFVKLLRLFLYNEGYNADIYEGEYDGINMDALDDSSELYSFAPRFVIVLMRHDDFRWDSEDSLKEAIEYTDNVLSHISKTKGFVMFMR